MASIGAMASKSNVMLDTILTKDDNTAGIFGVKFYIRGVPWVVAVDTQILL